MEVKGENFHYHLPRLLSSIAHSHFVSLDLEFSGISTRLSKSGPAHTNDRGGKQPLQARYEEAKEAAEKYQILQIGLTCVAEDTEKGVYTVRPYNLHLSPVLDDRLDVERLWSYQSSAIHFLLKNGFRMEAPFTEGVPYLSRNEEAVAKNRWSTREKSKSNVAAIPVPATDVESIRFMDNVRTDVKAWLAQGRKRERFLNIPKPSTLSPSGIRNPLATINNFQKRLVHQLVKAEYPDLVTIGRRDFVQILDHDKKREDAVKITQQSYFEERLSKQIGFRWIAEAMTGGDISRLDPKSFVSYMASDVAVDDPQPLQRVMKDMQDRLKQKRTILVGHNLFTDLVNFYSCFLGPLPKNVGDFQKAIHEIFPLVVDTKYLATHRCGSINPSSQLTEIEESLWVRTKPLIVTHREHQKYHATRPFHEAGYDSLLTAMVAIKLSARLEASGTYLQEDVESVLSDDDEAYFTTPEEPNDLLVKPSRDARAPNLNKENATVNKVTESMNGIQLIDNGGHQHIIAEQDRMIELHEKGIANSKDPKSINSDSSSGSVYLTGNTNGSTWATTPKAAQVAANWDGPDEVEKYRSVFSHTTKYDLLTDQTMDLSPPKPRPARNAQKPTPEASLIEFEEDILIRQKVAKGELMPRFDSKFWKVYGNKLRVFGTIEGVSSLDVD